jgi:UDP-N-acetylglucosamine 2-epimerase (non-hydrolysing)/UDP-GlcNAc3NAcA epimerase
LKALDELGRKVPIILPLHPRTKKVMNGYHLFSKFKNVRWIEPVSYLNMLKLEKNAKAILTDSGGVQKEAYWFRIPCVTLRDETEWVETVRSGWNKLAGTDPRKIVQEVNRLEKRRPPEKRKGIFGDGKASGEIVRILIRCFV